MLDIKSDKELTTTSPGNRQGMSYSVTNDNELKLQNYIKSNVMVKHQYIRFEQKIMLFALFKASISCVYKST